MRHGTVSIFYIYIIFKVLRMFNTYMRSCIVLLFFLLIGCERSLEPDPAAGGENFFPLEVGRFIEYDVVETRYPVNQDPVTEQYILKQEIASVVQNESGGSTYIIYRWRRPDEGAVWEFIETWSARKDINRFVVQEGNLPFIKLSLPPRNAIMWDGNALNALGEDTYVMTGLDAMQELPDGSMVPTVTVIQEEFDDIIVGERNIRRETYGRDIGLLQRESVILELCPIVNCPNEEVILSGTGYKETIRAYGKID